jgi:hypothetical protein
MPDTMRVVNGWNINQIGHHHRGDHFTFEAERDGYAERFTTMTAAVWWAERNPAPAGGERTG